MRLRSCSTFSPANLGPTTSPTAKSVDRLLNWHLDYPSVEFAYAYRSEDSTHMVRISEGNRSKCEPCISVRVLTNFKQFGIEARSTQFQNSASFLIVAARSVARNPEGLAIALKAMLRLFVERTHRDVGGFAVPDLKFRAVFSHRSATRLKRLSRPTTCSMRTRACRGCGRRKSACRFRWLCGK